MKKIKVLVYPSGEIKISTEGFSGSSCKEATKDLEKLLGQIENDKHTSEYYAEDDPNYIYTENK